MTPHKIAAELVDLNHHDAPGSGRQLMLWAVYLAETPVVTVWAMLSGNATGLSENQPRQYPLAGVGQDYPGDGGMGCGPWRCSRTGAVGGDLCGGGGVELEAGSTAVTPRL